MDADIHALVEEMDGVFKLTIPLPQDAWHGFTSESLWAEALEDRTMRVLNTPFFAKGISYEDVVSIKIGPEVIWFDSVVARGGHSTYRILLDKMTDEAAFQGRWAGFSALGCTYESFLFFGSIRMHAVDIPPSVDARKIYSLLESGEKKMGCGILMKEIILAAPCPQGRYP